MTGSVHVGIGLAALLSASALTESPPRLKEALPTAVAVDTNSLAALPYDAGAVKFIAETTQTGGRAAVLELTEMPGYKTAWHQHNNCEESFYVIEGTLTIRLRDQTRDLATGSYVWIPRCHRTSKPGQRGTFQNRPPRVAGRVSVGSPFRSSPFEDRKGWAVGAVGIAKRFPRASWSARPLAPSTGPAASMAL
jgi:mannose-6-phosphate isomerase-like protein (cupin superfamily)